MPTKPKSSRRATPAQRRRLPIGIQTFGEIREGGCYYVDKTVWLGRLVDEGKHYFLSRPRRFGKSLLLDTLKELFEGNEALFKGLAIHDRWDWSVRHPVLRLSFGSGSFKDPGFLGRSALAQLETIARKAGLPARYEDASLRFGDLIESLHEQTGRRVVVLVDEYDKPILDALESPDIARTNRDFLRGLYGTIKDSDAHVRFTLLTGVSRFSRVSLFSGLNNLKDITLDPRHGAICGYTEADLGTVFAPELAGLDREAIREWYNGYHWRGEERVYNPFDILLLFDSQEFGAYWFETGTPTFLVETLAGRGVNTFSLEGALASDALLSSFDVEAIAPEALLFQTGYLTIRSAEWCDGEMAYQLGYPNREVRLSLNRSLLDHLTAYSLRWAEHRAGLYRVLRANDFEGLEELLRGLFAGIPYEWHTNNMIGRYEGYYASVVYSCFAALGMDVTVEDSSAGGRLDMAVRFNGNVYLFELKVRERSSEGAAMAQLRERGYAEKYRGTGEAVYLIGVEFSEETRTVAGFEVVPGAMRGARKKG